MIPLLHDGDIVHFNTISFHRLAVDDIVTVCKNGSLFTHRVIYKGNNYFITKGDNSILADGKFYIKDLVGCVVKVTRGTVSFDPSNYYLIQSTLYFNELTRVFGKFNDSGVNYLVLKGLPLYIHIMGSYPRRIYADCDILVASKHRQKAIRILGELNFSKESNIQYRDLQRFIGREDMEVNYIKLVRGLPILLDVHFSVNFITNKVPSPFFVLKKILNDLTDYFLLSKRHILLGNHRIPILNPNTLLVYLLLHCFQHQWYGIYRYQFLTKVIRKYRKQIDWSIVISMFTKYRLIRYVSPSLYLLKKYFGITGWERHILEKHKADYDYALRFFKLVYYENVIFETELNGIILRIKKALMIFLLHDEPLFLKVTYLITNFRLTANLIYMVRIYLFQGDKRRKKGFK